MLHAVVVGINEYHDPDIRNLLWARADAEAVAALIGRIDSSQRSVRLILDEEATRGHLMEVIGEELPRVVTSEDVVLLYFAGHGAPEAQAAPDSVSRYLVTHDTRYGSVFATGIDMERDLSRLFERLSRPRLVLMLIDACFSGLAGGRTFEGPVLRRSRAHTRDLVAISLTDLDLGEGRLMIGACNDTELAREDALLGHGVFTHCLLQGPPQSHHVGERTIGIHSLYNAVAGEVRSYTKGRQTPVINGRSAYAQIPNLW